MPFTNITTALAIFALVLFAASHGHGALANVDHDLALRNTETTLRAKGPTEAAIGENPSTESIATFDTVAFPTTPPTGLTALDQGECMPQQHPQWSVEKKKIVASAQIAIASLWAHYENHYEFYWSFVCKLEEQE